MSTRSIACACALALASCTSRTSGSGDGDGGGGGGPSFGGAGSIRPGFGLVSAAPSTDALAVRWRRPSGSAAGFALFLDTSPGGLFGGAPDLVDPAGESALLTGLAAGTEYFLGLGVDDGSGGWIQAGPVLTARTRAIVYVDPSAGSGGDGSSPGSPLNNLLAGLLTAFANGGGNVWVAGGTIGNASFLVPEGVDVYGGFAADFDLATRDPAVVRTVLVGTAGDDMLVVEQGSDTRVLDGLWLDGTADAKHAIDVDTVSTELRSVRISGANRGMRLRNLTEDLVRVEVAACQVSGATLEGVSVHGAIEFIVDGSSFRDCPQEGMDLDDLIAPDGLTVRFWARESLFAGCGEEGLDCDLAAPLGGGSGGQFEVELESCDFAGNGLAGALVDIEYEATPGWSTAIRISGCVARRNGTHGLALDLDSRADVHVARVACVANLGHGLSVTSESADGVAQVDASLFLGNHGRGARAALGNFALLLSNCVLAGNHGGGVLSDTVEASAVSSVSYLQTTPFQGSLEHASVQVGAGDLPAFENAPLGIHRAVARDGGELTLAEAAGFAAGASCELDGDEVLRVAESVSGKVVVLDALPNNLTLPATLSSFAAGAGVVEDYAPTPASIVLDAGLPAPGGAATDAGPFGAPFGGAPGSHDPASTSPFFLSRVIPRIGTAIQDDASLILVFAGGAVSSGSLNAGVSAVDGDGDPLAASYSVDGQGFLRIDAPGQGWPDGAVVRIHRGLRNTAGAEIAAELAFRLQVAP